jgi:1-phosphofructokinase family hexose kinase
MITTVTLNPAIDREYFVLENKERVYVDIYTKSDILVTPGGKGLIAAINLKNLGHEDVQNIGFVGGRQGLFFEKMVQEFSVTTNYVYTKNEIRNNMKVIGLDSHTYSHYNDYTYEVEEKDVKELLKRFARSITDSDCVLISGSMPQGVGEDMYAKLVRICNEQGKSVCLQASGQAFELALKEGLELAVPYPKQKGKICDYEVETLEDYLRLGRMLIKKGARYVILPYECGRMILDKDHAYLLTIRDFCMVSFLGSGDAFVSAMMDYKIRNGFDLLKSCQYGAAAFAYISQNKSVFLTERSQIECMLDRIEIKKLEG